MGGTQTKLKKQTKMQAQSERKELSEALTKEAESGRILGVAWVRGSQSHIGVGGQN
jgi:hypothetical protein